MRVTLSKRAGLTRISHQLSAKTPNMPAFTALRLLGHLNVPSGTLPESSHRAPCIRRLLRRFATTPGEKCGLENRRVFVDNGINIYYLDSSKM
jgi:hypothetical protein